MSGVNRSVAGQEWHADTYATNARSVSEQGLWLISALAPQPCERILDLGCGDGFLTRRIAESGATVIGLEPDPDMAQKTRDQGVEVLEGDAHDLAMKDTFDAVVSNAALHWMRRPERVFANVFAALKPGGRFIAEQGGFGNIAAICTAILATLEARGHEDRTNLPWDFPTVETQSTRLQAAGFHIQSMTLIPQLTPLPTGLDGWLQTFAGPFVYGLPEIEQHAIRSDVIRRLKPILCDREDTWTADYVRLRFQAVRTD